MPTSLYITKLTLDMEMFLAMFLDGIYLLKS